MAVETYTPNADVHTAQEMHISATDSAVAHLASQQKSKPDAFLRLDLNNSGCSGFKYNLEFTNQLQDDDIALTLAENLVVHVPHLRYAMLQGTIIDYRSEGLNSALKYSNPNAEAECGCGESFSLKEPQ